MNSQVAFLNGDDCRVSELDFLPRPIVFTNGVFDILHRGHVEYLKDARRLGASLLVAINSDVSVRMLEKGDCRPINKEYDRALLVASLGVVSGVITFSDKTPRSVIQRFKPEVYVKGGDYDIETLLETSLVRSWGGTALSIPFRTGYSTTALISRISG